MSAASMKRIALLWGLIGGLITGPLLLMHQADAGLRAISTPTTLTAPAISDPTITGAITHSGANGQSAAIKQLTELTTIAAAATTDTAIQMPAGAIILAVSVRVTTVIPTAATFTVGDSGSAARFNTGASVLVAANTTDKGTKAGAYYNAGALAVRITPNLTPASATGVVRVTIHYLEITPPTS